MPEFHVELERPKLEKLKEEIAKLFNHGLTDADIVLEVQRPKFTNILGFRMKEEHLIAVIRDILTKPDDQ